LQVICPTLYRTFLHKLIVCKVFSIFPFSSNSTLLKCKAKQIYPKYFLVGYMSILILFADHSSLHNIKQINRSCFNLFDWLLFSTNLQMFCKSIFQSLQLFSLISSAQHLFADYTSLLYQRHKALHWSLDGRSEPCLVLPVRYRHFLHDRGADNYNDGAARIQQRGFKKCSQNWETKSSHRGHQ